MENKQIYFLPDNIINEIASKLNDCLPKETKKQLKAIQDKFGFKLTYDRQTNANLLWQSISDELKQTDIKKSHLYLGERTYVQMMNDAHSVSQDMLKAYIFPKYEKENSLIHNFNYEIIEHINAIIRIYGIFINIKLYI